VDRAALHVRENLRGATSAEKSSRSVGHDVGVQVSVDDFPELAKIPYSGTKDYDEVATQTEFKDQRRALAQQLESVKLDGDDPCDVFGEGAIGGISPPTGSTVGRWYFALRPSGAVFPVTARDVSTSEPVSVPEAGMPVVPDVSAQPEQPIQPTQSASATPQQRRRNKNKKGRGKHD